MPSSRTGLRSVRARLYTTVRTAHLERAHQLSPAAIVHVSRRYDFDEALITGLELVQASPLRAAVLLARSRVEVLEINEPLMVSSLRMTALAVAAVRLRGLVPGRRTEIVTYAIDNSDPWARPVTAGVRARARRRLERGLARFVWGRLDRICFGTVAARDVYAELFAPTRARQVLIPALPVALDAGSAGTDPRLVVFLGALSERKGIDRVLAAWPLVRQAIPDARLQVLGKGALEPEVRAAAAADESIDVLIDPPRAVIQQVLLRAQVLTLPSQPTATWREQVGLPIVEGLAAGCSIVTTNQTGLAPWLAEHGHSVVEPGCPAEELGAAIADQLAAGRSFDDVTAVLPLRDGRLEADAWLFGTANG